jgi:DNA-binding transcriptional ArsR family regulator
VTKESSAKRSGSSSRKSLGILASRPLPLGFPRERWSRFDDSEKEQFVRAQTVLDTFKRSSSLSVGALARDTALPQEHLSAALRLLEELSLVQVDEFRGQIRVQLIATPEDHIGVRFPDGQVRWVFIARPVREPELDPAELN